MAGGPRRRHLGRDLPRGLRVGCAPRGLAQRVSVLGRVELRGAYLIEWRRRDEENCRGVRGDVGVCDNSVQVGLVLVQGYALVLDFLREGGVVGAQQDELVGLCQQCRESLLGKELEWWDSKVQERDLCVCVCVCVYVCVFWLGDMDDVSTDTLIAVMMIGLARLTRYFSFGPPASGLGKTCSRIFKA